MERAGKHGRRYRTRQERTRFLATAVVLYVVWILFSARLELFWLAAGAVGSLGIAGMTHRVFFNHHAQQSVKHILNPFAWALAGCTLVANLYASSWAVCKAVFTKRIAPEIVKVDTDLPTEAARIVLGTSITFTPGTAMVSLEDSALWVHFLFAGMCKPDRVSSAIKGRMEQRLTRVWQ